jgi:hypothetical protein
MAMSANTNSNTGIQSPRMGGGSSAPAFSMPTLNLNINGKLTGSGTDLVAVINETKYSWNG